MAFLLPEFWSGDNVDLLLCRSLEVSITNIGGPEFKAIQFTDVQSFVIVFTCWAMGLEADMRTDRSQE
jgi:hypothetical protein